MSTVGNDLSHALRALRRKPSIRVELDVVSGLRGVERTIKPIHCASVALAEQNWATSEFANISSMAATSDDGWNRNIHYHDRLIAHVPSPCARALDVGCGRGVFARELARVADHVDAIDVDADVVDRARRLSADVSNVSFNSADFLAWTAEPYDFIGMVAALHHMPFDAAVAKATSLLRPGGVLGVVGLDRATSIFHEAARSAIAYPVAGFYTMTRRRAAVGAAIQEPTMTLSEIRQEAGKMLPGATIQRHVMWRYSLVWVKNDLGSPFQSKWKPE